MMVRPYSKIGCRSGILWWDSLQTPIPTQPSSSKISEETVPGGNIRKDTVVLDLEKAKDAQAKEIADLKKRVQRLERKTKPRTIGLKRLKKVSMSRRVESSKDQESLGDHKMQINRGGLFEDIEKDAVKLIVEYKLLKEGIMVHYQLIRADGSSKRYSSMIRMLQGIDREDLETLWKLVKTEHGDIRPKDEHERVLWGDLKVMFLKAKLRS
ncbi:hypothetical protein Tco_0865118 [Tanacetum coccineum]